MGNYIWEPKVAFETAYGLQTVDIKAKQLSQGIIHITGDITDALAENVISQIQYLANEDKNIYIFINTRGGTWTAGLAIVDIIRMYKERINTICTSSASSIGALILSSPIAGNRYIFPHANLSISGPALETNIQGSEEVLKGLISGIRYQKSVLIELLSENLSLKRDELLKLIGEESFLTAMDAVDLGICDHIVDSLSFIKQTEN